MIRRRVEFIIISIFLLMVNSVFAVSDLNYTRVSGITNNFHTETGFFNPSLIDYSIATKVITTPRMMPLVGDLDNDGENEIIVRDSNKYKLYRGINLNIVDTYISANLTASGHGHFLLFDIDGDGLLEIISADDDKGIIEIIKYDSGFTLNFSFTLGTHTDGEIQLGCKAVDDCIAIYSNKITESTNMYATAFTKNTTSNEMLVISETGANRNFCAPQIRNIQTHNINVPAANDEIEYIYSVWEGGSGSDRYFIQALRANGTNISIADTVSETSVHDLFTVVGVDTCISKVAGSVFSAPLVGEFTDSTGDGKEVVIGFMVDADEYNMDAYDSDLDFLDDFPEVADADGRLVSNPFEPDSSGLVNDFCIVGYEVVDSRMDVLCASLTDSIGLGLFDNVQYKWDDVPYNITVNYDYWSTLAHAGDMYSSDVPNTDELINTYGVFNLDYDSCSGITGNCDIEIIFDLFDIFGLQELSVIPIDLEKIGRNDLVALSPTNIYVIDDGFTNTPCDEQNCITEYIINPCLDSTWKQNTSVSVQVKIEDIDSDDVFANVTLYRGSAFSRSEQSINASSGSTFSFGFIANETIGSSTLRLEGFDVENPNEPDVIDLSFSVGSHGVEFGDCTTTVDIEAVVEAEEVDETEAEPSNAITTGMATANSVLGVGTTILWLIVMMVVGLGIYFGGAEAGFTGNIILPVFVIVEIITLIIGVILGFISTGIVITISIVGVIIIASYIKRIFAAPTS